MSVKHKTYIVPYDGSMAADKAARFAIEIAKDEATNIVFVHNQKTIDNKDPFLNTDLRNALIENRIPYELIWRTGILVDIVINLANEKKANMIIMGTNGNETNGRTTNTSKVIQKSNCSVLVVPQATKLSKIRKVAFACDFQNIKDSTVLMEFWFIALKMKAEVKIVFVNTEKKKLTEFWNEEVEQTLEFFFNNLPLDYDIVDGEDIEKTLKRYVQDKEIDLLGVLPRNHKKNKISESKGKLTKVLSMHTNIPILAVE